MTKKTKKKHRHVGIPEGWPEGKFLVPWDAVTTTCLSCNTRLVGETDQSLTAVVLQHECPRERTLTTIDAYDPALMSRGF
jgi:hypothetical protein